AGPDHHIGLAGAAAWNDAEAVEVIARHIGVHHFHRTTGQSESHRPERARARPVDDLVELGNDESLVRQLVGDRLQHRILGRAGGQWAIYSHSSAPFFHS